MRSPSSLFWRAGVAFGLSLALASTALLLLAGGEETASLASEGGPAGAVAGWTPAPLLALLIVAAMCGLVVMVTLRPRRG